MAVNIKNADVEEILDEVVRLTGESKTEAVRKALDERRQRLQLQATAPKDLSRILTFLQDEIWATIPPEILGTQLTKVEEETILGFGELGA